jgi:uncharacterized membrane protein YozB (DUF420 family)
VSATKVGLLVWIAQSITIVLAFVLARRRPRHRPFAVWAAFILASDLLCNWLNNGPLRAPTPYTGTLRVLFHVQQVLWLSEPIGLPIVAWPVFLERRPWPPLLAGGAAVAALAIGYPAPFRGAVLGYALATIQALSVLACVAVMAAWTRRRSVPRPEHAAVLLATLLTCVLFSGPYAPPLPSPFEDWSMAELAYLSIWSGLALLHAASIWGGFGMDPSSQDDASRKV